MNSIWKIRDAKNKFSEVITRALTQGPQLITRRGEKTVVVVSYAEYEKLRKPQGKLSAFLPIFRPLSDGVWRQGG